MKTTDLQTILRLDSIYSLLTLTERLHVRGVLLGWYWAAFPERLQPLAEWIEQSNYIPPDTIYGHDRLPYVVAEDGTKILCEKYAKQTENFKQQLLKLI